MKKLLTFLTLLTLFFGVGWAATVADALTYEGIGVSGTSYTEWSGKVFSTSAVYAGQSAGQYQSIQLRTKNSNSGIVSTSSGGTVKQITVTWNDNTSAGNSIDIYGKSNAYSSASELYGNNAGTKLGSIVKGTSTSLTISDDYAYIGIRSTSGAVYLDEIKIYWETGGGTTETCATPTFNPAEGTYTEAQNVTISCLTSGATIYYTTDGITTPTTSSSVYSSAIPVSSTTTIKAIAAKSGMNNSGVATATYTINSGSSPSSGRMTFVQTSTSAGTLTNAPSGVTATFSNTYSSNKEQITSGNTMTLTISGMSSRYKITGLTLNVRNNKSSGAGEASVTMNGNDIGSLSITGLGSTYSEQDVNITECPFTGNLVITLTCSTNSVFCNAFYIDYEEIAEKTYDVTVTQATGGTITASLEGEKVVDTGDKITVTATPDPGYELGSWTITGAAESAPDANNQITAQGNVTITATFNKIQYSITNVIKTNGNVSGAGGSLNDWTGVSTVGGVWGAQVGDEISFRADTYNGYQILQGNISITDAGGNAVSFAFSNNVVTFTMPASNVTITANYTTYRGTIRLAGRFNGNTGWRTGDSGPAFTYDNTDGNDKYTIDAYFTGEGDGNYFFITYDGNASYPSADGNWVVSNTTGTPVGLSWDGGGHNFFIENGVYTIELAGDLSTIAFTKKNPTITFSPASGSKVEQETSVSATSNLTTMIAAIKAIDSGAAGTVTVGVNTDNGNTWNASETLNTIGSATVYGKAYIGNISATGTANYTVVAANTSTVYELTTTLTSGKKYIIMSAQSGSGYALGEQATNNRRGSAEYIINDNKVTIGDDVQVITLEGNATNGWYFNVGNGYLYAASSNSNQLKTETAADDNAKAAISFDGNMATIVFQGTNTRNELRYNSNNGSPIFACYANSSTTGTNVYFFQQTEPVVKDYTITYAEVTGGSATGVTGANAGETITVTVTADDGYACSGVAVTTDEPDNSPLAVTDNHDGTYTFTVPSNFNGTTITVTPSFAQAYAITYVAEPADGGIVTGVASAVEGARVEVTVTPESDYQLSSLIYSWNNGAGSQTVGGAGTTENPYNFSMPHYATTVTATFVKVPHGISVTSAHGEVTGIPANATSGTEITFTVTPSAGYVVSSVSGTFNNGNSSLNITDNGNGTYTFSMPASDVAITVTYFASEDYELLTDLADINEEDTYLIVGGPASGTDKDYVMGNTGNGQRDGIGLTSSNYDSTTGIITSTADMAVVNFLIQESGDSKTYAIHTSAGYLNNTSTSGNGLTAQSLPAYATITLGDNSRATIQLVDNTSRGLLSYNTNGNMWKFYGGSQGANYIFKLANKNQVKRPTVTGAAGEYLGLYNFIGKDNVSLACATENAVIEYSLDGGTTWQTYSEAFEIATNAAGNTVVVQARATKSGMETSEVVTATFTCIKPTAPTFGTNVAGAYVNPVFVYPKSALNDRRAYGEESVSFCYTTTGTAADASSPAVTTSNSNGYYIVLDDNATLSVVTVINGIASDPAGGAYTFSVDAPAFSLAGGTYDGDQQTRLSTNTKTQLNGLTWNTVIYYTTGDTEFAFNATSGEVTSEGWVAYDATNNPYLDILVEDSPVTIKAVTLSNYFNGQSEYRASEVTTETFTLTAANLAITISPAAGTYVNAQNVTLGVKNNVGNYTIYYTTDGNDPSTNGTEYTGTAITVDHDMTIKVYAMDSRTGDGGTATAEAAYKIGIQPVVYSPFPGTIYKGDDDDITVEMFSVTPNAKIYYTVAEGEGNYPDPPTTSSTLYSAPIPLETGKVYNFKAIAVLGSLVSSLEPGTFDIRAKGTGWQNVMEMNKETDKSTVKYFENPVQVVYMSTWRYDQEYEGKKPEFCFVRDNSGYGMVYFGGSSVTKYNDWTKYKMGDWLAGGTISGKAATWNNSYINELGNNNGTVETWPSTALGNTTILPEETTNKAITDGWTYDGSYTGTDYATYVDPDKDLFGHYVHMRKNTVNDLTLVSGKYLGKITDQSGVPLNYYDGLYLFSGHGTRPTYDQAFFDQIQNKGGTFDIYAIVYFYGPNANNASYSNAPFEIFPIDFEWIYKPKFNIPTGTYHETQTISLTCDSEGAQIWYKTSEMEAYELYTGPFEVDATTTIEAYSTLPSKYNDVLESVMESITVTIGSVEAPEITVPSVVKTIGESVTTDITCATEGATIYYTTDGSDPKTSGTRIEYTLGQQLTFDETTTVRAIAMQDDYYSVEAESRTYTFVKSNGIEYTLVTSASQLNENSVYVIVNKANNMAMSTNQKTNNRDAAGVMFENVDKTIVYGNDDLAQFTLKKTGNNWYLQTNNSSENGYLSVGNGNTLLTSATADGNAEATITIDGTNADVDKANEAHISFIYNNETTRYLRYWNRDHLFNTYTTETNAPVFLYYKEATPLATIEKEGVKDAQYTVADQLIAVEYRDVDGGAYLWCKDQGNVSIDKTECTSTQVDFMKQQGQQVGEWDQSNWVVLKLTGSTAHNIADGAKGHYINPATVTGHYIDDVNYMIEVIDNQFTVGDAVEYTPNVYSPANFMPSNLNINGGQGAQTAGNSGSDGTYYFFMNPKVQEICKITYAEWYETGAYFTVPYTSGFDGAFNVAWTYNGLGNISDKLVDETAYYFNAVVTRTSKTAYGPKNNTTPNGAFLVYPTDLTVGNNIPTAINTVDTGKGEVKSIKYVNVAGMVSDVPFQGVNIVVTEYTDGSRTTTKMLRK